MVTYSVLNLGSILFSYAIFLGLSLWYSLRPPPWVRVHDRLVRTIVQINMGSQLVIVDQFALVIFVIHESIVRLG